MELVRQSPYTILTVDDNGWVTGGADNVSLRSPTPYKPTEAKFEASTEPRQNPLRLKSGSRLTKVIPLDPPYEKDIDGNDITEETVHILWKYCKQDGAYGSIIEMTQAEKDQVDANEKAEKQAQLDARRTVEENKDIFKIIFRMVNLHRPDNMKVTKEEAETIVNEVIK